MDFNGHPCFSAQARHTTARIHLPVAPKCNIQCNFCNRKYDCVNESRPGVCSVILPPERASVYLDSVIEKVPNIKVVGIAGPGDPFANPIETIRTMELVKSRYPDMLLCLATNGLGLPEYVERIAEIGVSHVTITLNAVDPEIGAKIYAWVRHGPHVYRGIEGAKLLLERQTDSIKKLKAAGITVKINTVIIPGINDEHAVDVARYASALGADIQNCIPLMHVEETAFAHIPAPDAGSIQALRFSSGKYLKQMTHCARCRADAAGLVGENNTPEIEKILTESAKIGPTSKRPYIAAASREGLLVNQHLGEATGLWIFGWQNGALKLITQRKTPVPGTGSQRWTEMAEILDDCFAVFASGCGESPVSTLAGHGLPVIALEGLIADAASPLFTGGEVPKMMIRKAGSCGSGLSCGGTGLGCA